MTKEEIKRHPQEDEKNEENETNEINETKTDDENKNLKPVPEVVANTKEEKKLIEEKNAKLKAIQEYEEKNVVLEKEAAKFETLASTMNTEPFIELKAIIKEAIKNYTDRDDLKEIKKKVKNFEAINSMENLLKEYNQLAEENRQNIESNNNEIENLKDKIEEIDSKLTNFQTKLDI